MSLGDGKLEELEKTWEKARELIGEISEEIAAGENQLLDLVTSKVALETIDEKALGDFAKRPYLIMPKSKNEAWIIVPRFVDFHVGWLERQTSSYNVFIVNQYIDRISPLPHDIKARVGVEPYLNKAIIHNRPGLASILLIDPTEFDRVKRKYRGKLGRRLQGVDDQIYIKKGSEFELLAELIADGMLPFEPKPVEVQDLREDPGIIELREYQERAWKAFLDYGAIGVYWAPGAGKTFLSLKAGNRIIGDKLVVVPQLTLKEQWTDRINTYAFKPSEWDIQTYQYVTHKNNYMKFQRIKYKIIIFDESHHLPANTFSRLAVLQTDYRIGLSASPYREDGRTEYIFALTGWPIGMKWRELISLGVVSEPDVKVYLYNTMFRKRIDLENLIATRSGKILIYCDSIPLGNKMARELNIPFVYGQTTNRLEILESKRVVMASRVADEGISLPELDTVIEYDFLYGSRRQEVQRAGRLMHGEGDGEHIIMMTEEELSKYEKRLYGLEEQGFRIRFERR